MMKMKNNIYFLDADENNQRLSEVLLTCVRNTAHERKQKVIILTDRCHLFEENARSISIRQLFLGLYREYKLGGEKTETFLSHHEHLVVVQLSIASWNKMKNDALEADVRSVLKVSKEILRRKLSYPDQTESQSLQTNCSKPDLLNTPKSHKSPQIQSPSGLRHSCLGIPESRTSPRRQTQGLPVCSPKTPAMVTGKLHLGSFCKTPEQNLDSQAISELLEQYNQFVQKCRKVDIVDVFLKVKEFFTSNVNEKVLFAQENLIIVEHLPRNDIEREMLTYLAGDVPVNCLSLNPELSANLSWEQCCMGGQDVYVTKLPVSSIWKSSQFSTLPPPNVKEETSSVSERFIRKLLLSYISLLVNSADELALARCLCLPDRGLSHKGFTALKHLAAKKKMSMFLTTFSFVFEMRREKATSESYAPLFPYSKALGEFVDLADKLMIITQDIPTVDLAVEKVFKTLKKALTKSRTCVLRPTSVEKVCAELLSEIHQLLQEDMFDLKVTPKCPVFSAQVYCSTYLCSTSPNMNRAPTYMSIAPPDMNRAPASLTSTPPSTKFKHVGRSSKVQKVVWFSFTLLPVGCGGSMRGQKVIKLFRSVLDLESTKLSQNQGTEDLYDQESSQSTPVQFPSLLSQFSSPQVVDKPLDTKCMKEQSENKSTATFSYTKSHYGWAAQDISLKENYPPEAHCRESDTARDTYKPQISHKRPIVYETLEKHHKNEQLSESPIEAPVSSSTVADRGQSAPGKGQPLTTPTAGIKVNKNKGPSLKRKKLQLEQNEKLKRARKGDSKKKIVPVPKGQKLLTNFFKTS